MKTLACIYWNLRIVKSKKIINTSAAPKAIGPYSQGIIYDDLIFTSGQIPINTKTNDIISDNFNEQAKQVLENIKQLIESQGASIDNIIKLTVYMIDLSYFDSLNKIFIDFFKDNNLPARSVVEVSKLPKNSKIEIEAICHI